jgi:hypothetical protein
VLAAFVMVALCYLLCLVRVRVGVVGLQAGGGSLRCGSGIEEIGRVRQVTRRVKEPSVHVCCRE